MKNKSPEQKISKRMIFSIIFFLSLFLFGINANEPGRVLEQAKNICLECIGIG